MIALSRILSLAAIGVASLTIAIAPPRSADAQAPRADSLQVAPIDGVLVLRSGSVLHGKTTRQGDRYHIALPDGEIRVRADQVEMCCSSIDEAYQRKREAIERGGVGGHLDLAEWCIHNGLLGYASRELMAARAADSAHPRIGLVERRLEIAVRPPAPRENTDSAAAEIGEKRSSENEVQELFRGLRPGAVEHFTATIQPLLMNRCSIGGCHGPNGRSEFRLERITANRMLTQRITQRNLESTLAWIQLDNPEESPLLRIPLAPHGNAKGPIFAPHEIQLYRQLSEWVNLVSQPTQPARPASVGMTAAPLLQTMRNATPSPGNAEEIVTPSPNFAAPAFGEIGQQNPEGDVLRGTNSITSRQPERTPPKFGASLPPVDSGDPFDPEIFNRQYGPK